LGKPQYSKTQLILEILDLIEKLSKDKEWLIAQLSSDRPGRNNSSIKARYATMTLPGILDSCSPSFLSTLRERLDQGGLSLSENLSDVRVFHWFFTDIVASANPNLTTEEQTRRIVVLNELARNSSVYRNRNQENTLSLATGDGMAIGFTKSPEEPLLLAIQMSKALNYYNKNRKDKVFVRIGLDSGPVFMFKDINGKLNAWGQGIIMARRIMDLGGEMHILASDNFVNQVQRLRPEYKDKMKLAVELAGYYSVKHDERILVYNLFGEGFGNKVRPNMPDVAEQERQVSESVATKRFLFSSIEIYLDVTDIKTMLTHHKIIWNVINITKHPVERIFYFIGGDCPRSFPDLHVSVRDEKNRQLQILEVSLNKPESKQFWVKANRPINPNENGRSLIWEYDWEEPERQFLYQFASHCSKFKIQITVPKGFETNQKVVKVDMATGDKTVASTPASVKYLSDRTIINWSAKNLQAYDAFRFDW